MPDYLAGQAAFRKAMAVRPWVGHASSQGETERRWAGYLEWTGVDPAPMLRSAVASFRAGLELNPGSYQCHTGLAKALLELARFKDPDVTAAQVQAHLERSLELNPRQGSEPWLLRVRAARLDDGPGMSRTAQALALAMKKLSLPADAPDLAETLLSLDALPAQTQRLAQLLPSLANLRRQAPDDSALAWLEARVLMRAGKPLEAQRSAAAALALNANLKAAVLRAGLA